MSRMWDKVAKRQAENLKRSTNRIVYGFGFILWVCALALALACYCIHLTFHTVQPKHEFPPTTNSREYLPAFHSGGVPSRLLINGEEWNLVEAISIPLDGVDATTECQYRRIAYIRIDDPNALRNALMHEVFHAGACLHGGDEWWNSEHPTPMVHPGVKHLGEFMSSFIHDNPIFVAWMMQSSIKINCEQREDGSEYCDELDLNGGGK